MSYRCPDCNKFVSTELAEPQVENCEIEETTKGKADLHLEIALSRICSECGSELATASYDAIIEIALPDFDPV